MSAAGNHTLTTHLKVHMSRVDIMQDQAQLFYLERNLNNVLAHTRYFTEFVQYIGNSNRCDRSAIQ